MKADHHGEMVDVAQLGEPLSEGELRLARTRLQLNLHIRHCLGKWIEPVFKRPVLRQNILLDIMSDDASREVVDKLERVLSESKANCQNFAGIFKENPTGDTDTVSSKILDFLAEVEAYAWLRKIGFRDVLKLRESSTKTVDFLGKVLGERYGAEVTRLGVPCSNGKTVKPFDLSAAHVLFSGKEASPKIQAAMWGAVDNKLGQLREFRKTYDLKCRLIISTGRWLGPGGSSARQEAGTLPGAYETALQLVWDMLDSHPRDLLGSLVILDGTTQVVHPTTTGLQRTN